MKQRIAGLTVCLLLVITSTNVSGDDYTSRRYSAHSCELFAKDAYQAAANKQNGISLADLLQFIDTAPVSDSQKHRAFQAIQLVWKYQLDNPLLAYTLAMGLCLQPRQEMAPMDEPWITSPRTIREHF